MTIPNATVYLDPSGDFQFADRADVCVKDLSELLARVTADKHDDTGKS